VIAAAKAGGAIHTVLLVLALGALKLIELEVDMREAPRRLVHAKMTIPAKPGPLVLVQPKSSNPQSVIVLS
jgi:hypothetical protein